MTDPVREFIRAFNEGDLDGFVAVLDPEVALRLDETALQMGLRTGFISGELRGAEVVAKQFSGAAQAAQLALIDGMPGAVWVAGGKPRVATQMRLQPQRMYGRPRGE